MVSLLSKLFIRDRENVTDPSVRQAYGTLCGLLGIALNILLFAGKYFAGAVSGSIAIVADSFNNLSDAGSSVVTLLGFRLANRRPDPEHPYGHGRMEYVSGLIVAGVILLMGLELGKSSVEKILHPEELQAGWLPAAILLVSIGVKIYMSLYNRGVGKKINSSAMAATATDSLSDAVATTVVLLSMGVAVVFHINIDGWAGLLVAAFILFAGYNAAKDTLAPLLGQPPEPEFVDGIEALVLAHPEVEGIHDLIVHDYGPGRRMISLHAEVDGKKEIFALHDAIDNIERELGEHFGCLATIHMDPIETDNAVVTELKAAVTALVQEIDPVITLHDFRMVPGDSHTNLIFDVVVPHAFRMDDAALKTEIEQRVRARYPQYCTVLTVDKAYA